DQGEPRADRPGPARPGPARERAHRGPRARRGGADVRPHLPRPPVRPGAGPGDARAGGRHDAARRRRPGHRGRPLAGRPRPGARAGARPGIAVWRDRGVDLRDGREEGGGRLRENTLAVALYPGSFDPVHNGHLDIIDRARRMYRRVVVAVAENVEKEPMFRLADRVAMLRAAAERAGIEVMSFEGLAVEFAHRP